MQSTSDGNVRASRKQSLLPSLSVRRRSGATLQAETLSSSRPCAIRGGRCEAPPASSTLDCRGEPRCAAFCHGQAHNLETNNATSPKFHNMTTVYCRTLRLGQPGLAFSGSSWVPYMLRALIITTLLCPVFRHVKQLVEFQLHSARSN